MRYLIAFFTLCLLCAAPAQAAGEAPRLSIKGDSLVVAKNGKTKTLSPEEFPVPPVEGSKTMRFFLAGPDDAKKLGIKAGMYIFDSDKLAGFAPTEIAEFGSDVLISPHGKILALNAGMSLVRDGYFFSYPQMKPMGKVVWYQVQEKPILFWNGEKEVFYSFMDDVNTGGRDCQYDPCGPVSVRRHSFADGKTTTILAGTPLCDYTLLAFDNGEITAEKLCLKTAEEWKQFPEGKPTEKIKVKP